MTVDFRVQGQYAIEWQESSCHGKFLEIIPNEKIVFSWKKDQERYTGCANTKVTIVLTELTYDSTEMYFSHSGFTTSGFVEDHKQGWTSSLLEYAADFKE